MKAISTLLALSTLAACSVKPDNGSSPESAVASENPEKLVLTRDQRPVDGDLQELFLNKDGSGTYSVSLHTNFYDRLAGREVDDTKSFGESMACVFKRNTVSTEIKSITCTQDMRPVDGDLTIVSIKKNSSGTYDAKLTKKFFDRVTGKNVTKKSNIADSLAIASSAPAKVTLQCTLSENQDPKIDERFYTTQTIEVNADPGLLKQQLDPAMIDTDGDTHWVKSAEFKRTEGDPVAGHENEVRGLLVALFELDSNDEAIATYDCKQ